MSRNTHSEKNAAIGCLIMLLVSAGLGMLIPGITDQVGSDLSNSATASANLSDTQRQILTGVGSWAIGVATGLGATLFFGTPSREPAYSSTVDQEI